MPCRNPAHTFTHSTLQHSYAILSVSLLRPMTISQSDVSWWMCSDDLEGALSGFGIECARVSVWCWRQGCVHSIYWEEMTSQMDFLPRWSKNQTPPHNVKRDAIGWNGSIVTGSSNHSNRGGVCVASLALLSFLCSPFRKRETKTRQIWDGVITDRWQLIHEHFIICCKPICHIMRLWASSFVYKAYSFVMDYLGL